MTLRQRIEILLDHYRDVLEGLYDQAGRADELLALMCRDWNHPSYQQLERLIGRMRSEEPALAWNLTRRYLHYHEVRRAWCPRCGYHPPAHVGKVHSRCKVKGRSTTLQPRLQRVHGRADMQAVERAITWLADHWQGEADFPEHVAAIERERLLRKEA